MKCSNCGMEFEGNFCPECGTPAQKTVIKCPNCGTEFKGNFCPQCGTPAQKKLYADSQNSALTVQTGGTYNQTAGAQQAGESRFTGGAFANFFIGLFTIIVTIITLSLAYPAMKCWKMRWETRHTYINGRPLTFDGKARQIYGKYILWLFLSLITLGIYYIFCMRINLIKWQTKHTHISGVKDGKSEFTGGALGYIGTSFICTFVTLITLTLGMYWARCHKERWLAKHKVIDGLRLEFDGKAIQYFGKRVLWTFLTIITLFIYSFWLIIKSKKWIASHTHFATGQQLPPITGDGAQSAATPAVKNTAPAVRPATMSAAAPATAKSTNGFAIAGFVLSFVAFPLLGIIFSAIGLSKSKTLNSGKGLSIAGLIISILYTLYIIVVLIAIGLFV